MKTIASLIIILLTVVSSRESAAQTPPFQYPSLDSECYYPQIGNRSQMDTLVGWKRGQGLGSPVVKNLGRKPDGGYGNMFIGDLTPPRIDPNNIFYTLSQVETGPGFDLHHMKEHLQQRANPTNFNGLDQDVRPIHFRDRTHLDLIAGPGIYLADDNGNYDTSRYVALKSSLHGDLGDTLLQFSYRGGFIPPYITRLTSDTVDDVVLAIYTTWRSFKDTCYLLLFRGHAAVTPGDTLYEDTSCILFPSIEYFPNRLILQGDFRGTGREDLVISGDSSNGWPGSRIGDLFFFANDPPFSLQKLADAINYDTLMARWQNPHLVSSNVSPFGLFTMPTFPKSKNDRSSDLLISCQMDTDDASAIIMLRGGPEFGSHRITLDSAGYVIHNPLGKSYGWPLWMSDAGDMTGTGNHVLRTTGTLSGQSVASSCYVTGEALDDKVDMYNVHPYGEGKGDTLTANGDNREDYLIDLYVDIDGAPAEPGSLWLFYGTKNIPVHLNPKFARSTPEVFSTDAAIVFSPNPITGRSSMATISWPKAEAATYEVRNLLGQLVQSGTLRMLGGAEQQPISFPGLSSGVYYFTLYSLHAKAQAKLTIAH